MVEIREGLYLLKLGPGQGNKVNEPVNIKNDPGIFMVLGRTARVELRAWPWEPLRHEHGKGQNSR